MKAVPALKTLAFLPMLLGAASTLHAGSPLLDLGESACAYFVCDAGITYTDNVFATHQKTDDVIFNIAPGIELNIGRESNNQFKLIAKENLLAYIDHSELNDQLASVDASYVYDAGRALSAKINAGFHQLNQNTNTIGEDGDLVKRNVYDASILLDYKITEKSILEAGFNYNALQFTNSRETYNDQSTYGVPVRWLYQVTDKLFAGLTYQYSYTDIESCDAVPNPGNQQVHFAGLTARGELSPKINIQTDLGAGYSQFNDRRYPGLNQLGELVWIDDDRNDTTFNFSLKADYQATDKLVFTLVGGRSFNVGGQAQAYTNTFVNLNGLYTISPHWEANANVGYAYQSFDDPNGGNDKITSLGCGISYLPNQYWRISLGYNFLYDDSNRIENYNINTLALTASLKY